MVHEVKSLIFQIIIFIVCWNFIKRKNCSRNHAITTCDSNKKLHRVSKALVYMSIIIIIAINENKMNIIIFINFVSGISRET